VLSDPGGNVGNDATIQMAGRLVLGRRALALACHEHCNYFFPRLPKPSPIRLILKKSARNHSFSERYLATMKIMSVSFKQAAESGRRQGNILVNHHRGDSYHQLAHFCKKLLSGNAIWNQYVSASPGACAITK
jgi:hypothetical protein